MRPLYLVVLLAAGVGCQPPDAPPLDTPADSLAFRVTEASGGLEAWDALPGIVFEWAVVRDSVEVIRNRHSWDKAGDRARTEFRIGEDSVVVALFAPSTFDPDAPLGEAALNGTPLSGAEAAEQLVAAHAWFINDGFWLLAPLKVFDPGVQRSIEPIEGPGQGLGLSFQDVGLTPGDRYILEVDGETGSVTGWTYVLESGNEGAHDWIEPVTLNTPQGPLTLATRKVSRTGSAWLVTSPELLPESDDSLFTNLTPRGTGS